MKTSTFVILLIIFLGAFLGLRPFTTTVLQAQDVQIMGVSIFGMGFQVFLAIGIVFLEFVIIFVSLLDRIGETIKAVLKPLLSLLPLGFFVSAVQKTFTPIFLSVLPDNLALQFGGVSIAADAGMAQNENYIAAAVADGSFATNVLLTVVTMLFFAVISYFTVKPRDFSGEVKRLRAENARFKKLLQ